MEIDRRAFLQFSAAAGLTAAFGAGDAKAQSPGGAQPEDRVFITNEDSNTVTVIEPRKNSVETTINLTSFDEDPRPPFRFVTAGVVPAHAAMIHKPMYHGASTPTARYLRPIARRGPDRHPGCRARDPAGRRD